MTTRYSGSLKMLVVLCSLMSTLLFSSCVTQDYRIRRACKEFTRRDIEIEGETFDRAQRAGDHKVLKWFKDLGYDKSPGSNSMTILTIALAEGYTDIVEEQLTKGADPNKRLGRDCEPPLMIALRWGRPENQRVPAYRKLIEYGADVNFSEVSLVPEGKTIDTPLMRACENDKTKAIAWLLLQHGARIDGIFGQGALLAATRGYNWDIVKYLVTNGVDMNARTLYTTPIETALVDMGSVEMVQFLVQNGACITNDVGSTVLRESAERWSWLNRERTEPNLEMIRYLMDHGARPNLVTIRNLECWPEQPRRRLMELLEKYGWRGQRNEDANKDDKNMSRPSTNEVTSVEDKKTY